MAQNSSSGVRTRHVDTMYHFIRENLEDGIINIEFFKSAENDSDVFTKKVNQEIYKRHQNVWKPHTQTQSQTLTPLRMSIICSQHLEHKKSGNQRLG